jgi:TonB family protein
VSTSPPSSIRRLLSDATLLATLVSLGCGAPVESPRRLEETTPSGPRSDWLVVDAEENAAIEGECVHAIGFDGLPPQPIERRALELPPGANPERRPVIVETVIGPSGRIARARIVKGPTGPEVERAVVRALEGWWFEPARERETLVPVAVRFVVSPRFADEQPSTPVPEPPPRAGAGGG